MVNRRRFVTGASATVMLAGLRGLFAPAVEAGGNRKLQAAWWRKRLSKQAELQGDNWHLVEIAEVHDAGTSVLEQFTIAFRGAIGDPIADGIYDVRIDRARVKLFVLDAGSDELGSYSVATVSRFR